MANASPADLRAGWEIFRKDPDLSLDQVNRRLANLGRGEVHTRTLQHYRSLLRAGFDRYVPMNRFDVARATRPYEGISALPRYFYYGTSVPVTLSYARGGKRYAIDGTAERIGEAGALLTVDDAADVELMRKHRPSVGTDVSLSFGAPVGETTMARVVESELDQASGLIEVEFNRLMSLSNLGEAGRIEPAPVIIRVTGITGKDHAADLIGRRLFFVLDAMEAGRSIANEVLRTESPSTAEAVVDIPQMRRLRLENPLLVELGIPVAVSAVVAVGWALLKAGEKLAGIYKIVQSAGVDKSTAAKIEAEAKMIMEETQSVALGNVVKREQVSTTAMLFRTARAALQDVHQLRSKPLLTDLDEARRRTLAHEVLESLESLRDQDVEDVDFEVGGNSSS